MTFYKKILFISSILCFTFIDVSFAQPSSALTSAIERLFNKIESDIISTAQAMPEEKFYFTPESLHIKNSDFKGVRTFAGQIMHLATDNILIWSAITGDSVRSDITDVNGPTSITTKAGIIRYLKSSFDEGRNFHDNGNKCNAYD